LSKVTDPAQPPCSTTLEARVDDPCLFTEEVDGSIPWKPDSITQFFTRLRERVGLEHLSFHDLRPFRETYSQDLGFASAAVAMRASHDPSVMAGSGAERRRDEDLECGEGLGVGAPGAVIGREDARRSAQSPSILRIHVTGELERVVDEAAQEHEVGVVSAGVARIDAARGCLRDDRPEEVGARDPNRSPSDVDRYELAAAERLGHAADRERCCSPDRRDVRPGSKSFRDEHVDDEIRCWVVSAVRVVVHDREVNDSGARLGDRFLKRQACPSGLVPAVS